MHPGPWGVQGRLWPTPPTLDTNSLCHSPPAEGCGPSGPKPHATWAASSRLRLASSTRPGTPEIPNTLDKSVNCWNIAQGLWLCSTVGCGYVGVIWSMNMKALLIITLSMTNNKLLVNEMLHCTILLRTRDIFSMAAPTPASELALEKLFVWPGGVRIDKASQKHLFHLLSQRLKMISQCPVWDSREGDHQLFPYTWHNIVPILLTMA